MLDARRTAVLGVPHVRHCAPGWGAPIRAMTSERAPSGCRHDTTGGQSPRNFSNPRSNIWLPFHSGLN